MSARVSTSSALKLACSGAMYKRRAGDAAEGREQALLGQPQPAGGLGQAEVDHLGDRLVVVGLDQDVGGLEVAVDDPLLVRVLHGRADLAEQGEPGGEVEAVAVAILGDRDPFHQLHHEEGAAVGRRAGVEDAGDVGVFHQGQGLALRLEAGQDVARVHPRLDQFQGHLTADRPELLGEVDRAHAPLADLLADLVAIGDDRIDEVRAVVLRSIDGGAVVRDTSRSRRGDGPGGIGSAGRLGIGGERPIQGAGRLVVGGQQGVEPVAQLGVVADFVVEERPAIGGVVPLDGRQEQGFDSLRDRSPFRGPPDRGSFPTIA